MFEVAIDILNDKVPKMRDLKLNIAKCHCKSCGGKNTVTITRQEGRRGDVVRWRCSAEGCSNMGMT